MASVSPLSLGAMPVGANAAYGIGPSVAATVLAGGAMTNPKARAAAEDFEAMFLNSMFSQMTSGIKGEGPFGDTPGTGVWRSMLTDEYSKSFAKAGGVGISNEVYRTLILQQAKRTSET